MSIPKLFIKASSVASSAKWQKAKNIVAYVSDKINRILKVPEKVNQYIFRVVQ